jgi:hypothetical protein
VRHRRVTPPFIAAFWEYKPTPDWSIHFELDNLGRFGYEDIFFNYAGPRNVSTQTSIEEISIKSQPRLFIEIRKTFD